MAMWRFLESEEVRDRIEQLELPLNHYGIDPYGVSRSYLSVFYTCLGYVFRNYFRVKSYGLDHVPEGGRFMLIGNHSGSVPIDGAMVLASLFFHREPPLFVHGMFEEYAQDWPFVSMFFSRIGQFPGLPEHAVRLLEDDRPLMIFPEGNRGTSKLFKDRYRLARFGTRFMRFALRTKSPIVPFAFVGGDEVLPTIFDMKPLARLLGTPYWPVPPYILPIPLPRACQIHYGEPMEFEGDGREPEEVIGQYVEEVKTQIERLIAGGRRFRKIKIGRGSRLEGWS